MAAPIPALLEILNGLGSFLVEITVLDRKALAALKGGEHLAQFIVESRWSDVPLPVRKEAKRSIINHIGCALGG